jgi:hypothetical protein
VLTLQNKLWRAVLEQAYEDAEACANAEDGGPDSRERINARRYLRADTPKDAGGLQMVCAYADVPMDRVVRWARRRYLLAA